MKTNGYFQPKRLFKHCTALSYAEAFAKDHPPNYKRFMWIYDPKCYERFADQPDSENAKCEVILWRTEDE